jgi:hypothetical protein
MKMKTLDSCFLRFFDGKPNVRKEVKLKTPRELQVRILFNATNSL